MTIAQLHIQDEKMGVVFQPIYLDSRIDALVLAKDLHDILFNSFSRAAGENDFFSLIAVIFPLKGIDFR